MFPVQNMFFPFFFDAPAIVFVGIWFLMRLTQGTGELLTPETRLVGARRGLPCGPVSRKSAGPAKARASTLLR
jgi:hypothetical protein